MYYTIYIYIQCNYIAGCKDKAIECSYQAFKGECERNPYYMRTVCPVSCGTCGNAYGKLALRYI